jgi:hypothetical protein
MALPIFYLAGAAECFSFPGISNGQTPGTLKFGSSFPGAISLKFRRNDKFSFQGKGVAIQFDCQACHRMR